jgi:ATP-dependent RNA helicase DOB1
VIPEEKLIEEYYGYRQQLELMKADFREVVTHPSYSLPFLQPGRLVKVNYQKLDFGWGVIINFQKRVPGKVRYHSGYRYHALAHYVVIEQAYAKAGRNPPA